MSAASPARTTSEAATMKTLAASLSPPLLRVLNRSASSLSRAPLAESDLHLFDLPAAQDSRPDRGPDLSAREHRLHVVRVRDGHTVEREHYVSDDESSLVRRRVRFD